jgi:hypothetical protein
MITNEQIQQTLRGIETPTENSIRETLNALLLENGLTTHHSNGIFNPNTNLFEGLIMDGDIPAPILHYTYDWDTDEFILIP